MGIFNIVLNFKKLLVRKKRSRRKRRGGGIGGKLEFIRVNIFIIRGFCFKKMLIKFLFDKL